MAGLRRRACSQACHQLELAAKSPVVLTARPFFEAPDFIRSDPVPFPPGMPHRHPTRILLLDRISSCFRRHEQVEEPRRRDVLIAIAEDLYLEQTLPPLPSRSRSKQFDDGPSADDGLRSLPSLISPFTGGL